MPVELTQPGAALVVGLQFDVDLVAELAVLEGAGQRLARTAARRSCRATRRCSRRLVRLTCRSCTAGVRSMPLSVNVALPARSCFWFWLMFWIRALSVTVRLTVFSGTGISQTVSASSRKVEAGDFLLGRRCPGGPPTG